MGTSREEDKDRMLRTVIKSPMLASAASRPVSQTARTATRGFAAKVGDEVPVNILKEGKNPVIKERDEYPEWLFKVVEPRPAFAELERRGFYNLDLKDKRRFLTLMNRQRIKEKNAMKSKK